MTSELSKNLTDQLGVFLNVKKKEVSWKHKKWIFKQKIDGIIMSNFI